MTFTVDFIRDCYWVAEAYQFKISLALGCFYHGHRMIRIGIFLALFVLSWDLSSSNPNKLSVDTCCDTYIQDWYWCPDLEQRCDIQYLCVPEFKSCYGKQVQPQPPPNNSTVIELCFLREKSTCCPQESFDRLEKLFDSCQGPSMCRDQTLDPCQQE